MKLIDTVVIIGSLDTGSDLHHQCMRHLKSLDEERETFLPTTTVLEADLVMKGRGYNYEERKTTWQAIDHWVPSEKVIANTIPSIGAALVFQEKGMDYFDSLISSLAKELGAKVVTIDKAIRNVVETEW